MLVYFHEESMEYGSQAPDPPRPSRPSRASPTTLQLAVKSSDSTSTIVSIEDGDQLKAKANKVGKTTITATATARTGARGWHVRIAVLDWA